jgi:hypothetical protein
MHRAGQAGQLCSPVDDDAMFIVYSKGRPDSAEHHLLLHNLAVL